MTPQPTLFDAIEREKRDKEIAEQLDKEIAILEARIAKAETLRRTNPGLFAKWEADYWKTISEHVAKVTLRDNRKELKSVTLQLPPNVQYGRESKKPCNIVRVLFNSEPATDDEVTLGEFEEFMSDMGWIKEAMSES